MDVLVALPYSPKMGEELVSLMFTNLKAMECANHGFNLHLALYDRPFNNSMNAKATKLSGRSVPPIICTNKYAAAGAAAAAATGLQRRLTFTKTS